MNPVRKSRFSLRLQEYDYTSPGRYFITIVSYQRQHLFGEIDNGEICINEWGRIAKEEWFRTAELRNYVELLEDEFIVMPDHVHGIIRIREPIVASVGVECRSTPTKMGPIRLLTNKPPQPGSLGAIVRAYKSAVTYRINELRNSRGAPFWSRNYYEHVIRDDDDMEAIHTYIDGNPACWEPNDHFQF